jgi:tRNA(fMet)-specific endonuclease VapC
VEAVIVDTDILSDFLNGKEEAVKLLNHYKKEHKVVTTDINVFELYFGAYKSEKHGHNVSKLKGFLNKIPAYSTSEDNMEMAGKLMAEQEKDGKRVRVKDVLIGSIATLENEPVLTRNSSEFDRLEGVETLSLEPETEQ